MVAATARPADVKREIGAAIGDPVEIVPLFCREARLEAIIDDIGAEHADRVWPQMRVEPVAKPARHEMPGDIAMRNLPQLSLIHI